MFSRITCFIISYLDVIGTGFGLGIGEFFCFLGEINMSKVEDYSLEIVGEFFSLVRWKVVFLFRFFVEGVVSFVVVFLGREVGVILGFFF